KRQTTGKRPATSVEGTDGGSFISPSQGARQYGDADVSGPTYCSAFVEEQGSRILVDTGSSVTIISAKFFDKIAGKPNIRPITKKTTYKIQGVTGHLEEPKGEVKNVPLKFRRNGPTWGLNACIMNSAAADIILGTNFLNRYKALLNLPEKKLTLTNLNGIKEEIPLVEKHQLHIRPVNVIEAMDTEQSQELDAMEIDPNPKWKCMKGPKELNCIPVYTPDHILDDPEPCEKCAKRQDEYHHFRRKKSFYEKLKY
ncbi:5655_t:CDS:1, partial [Paraglomus occultum]